MEMRNKPFGTLYVVSTPIGNLEDITLRALRVLKEADLVAAEDTRRTRQLLTHYGIHKPLVSYHEHNERARAEGLLQELREGKSVALVTDAGTPGISDPGVPLIREAVRQKIPLVPIPGPAAAVAALSISGLPTDRFVFYGFLPAKPSARKNLLAGLRRRPETLVFYESPRRLPAFLRDAREILGNRPAAVAREITKVYEETLRGTLSELSERIGEEEVRGEVTVILAGQAEEEPADPREIREALQACLDSGVSRKEAVEQVARGLNAPKREVYGISLEMREGPEKND
jgi:16S rRNA (cytidine1402-2'-O)-methyltransferase